MDDKITEDFQRQLEEARKQSQLASASNLPPYCVIIICVIALIAYGLKWYKPGVETGDLKWFAIIIMTLVGSEAIVGNILRSFARIGRG